MQELRTWISGCLNHCGGERGRVKRYMHNISAIGMILRITFWGGSIFTDEGGGGSKIKKGTITL